MQQHSEEFRPKVKNCYFTVPLIPFCIFRLKYEFRHVLACFRTVLSDSILLKTASVSKLPYNSTYWIAKSSKCHKLSFSMTCNGLNLFRFVLLELLFRTKYNRPSFHLMNFPKRDYRKYRQSLLSISRKRVLGSFFEKETIELFFGR